MCAQVCDQLLLQYAARLHEQALVDRLVGNLHARGTVVGAPKPAGNLLGRPVQAKLRRDAPREPWEDRQFAALRPPRRVECSLVSDRRTIRRTVAMPGQFTTDGRRGTLQLARDCAQR